jgi:hypothetical protein
MIAFAVLGCPLVAGVLTSEVGLIKVAVRRRYLTASAAVDH